MRLRHIIARKSLKLIHKFQPIPMHQSPLRSCNTNATKQHIPTNQFQLHQSPYFFWVGNVRWCVCNQMEHLTHDSTNRLQLINTAKFLVAPLPFDKMRHLSKKNGAVQIPMATLSKIIAIKTRMATLSKIIAVQIPMATLSKTMPSIVAEISESTTDHASVELPGKKSRGPSDQ